MTHPGGGRTQAVGIGGDVLIGDPLNDDRGFYLLLGASVERAFTSHGSEFRPPDIESGFHPYGSVGLGTAVGVGNARLLAEGRIIYGAGGPLGVVSLGLGSRATRRDPRERLASSAFAVLATTFTHTNRNYRQDEDFRGYVVWYEHALAQGRFRARAALGIDFLRFLVDGREWSTGAVDAAVSVPVTVLAALRQVVRLSVVPEIGGLLFTEPQVRAYPIGRLGAELTLTFSGAGLVAGVSGALGNGPGGTLSGWQPRLGVQLSF
jgi:hypothetical protein